MKKCLVIAASALFMASCGGNKGSNGQLTGVLERPEFQQADPYGMVFIPQGSYTQGPSDQDVFYAQVAQSKVISVPAFYIDDTEITNNEYRQFVYWVRDSIAHRLIGGDHLINEGEYDERIDWTKRIEYESEDNQETLGELYLAENERFFKRKELDTRKLNYEYYQVAFKDASRRATRSKNAKDRSGLVRKGVINIFPDTLAWLHDFTYSYNEPLTQSYFWHPAYDDYPVVGVNWKQANAFCNWRTLRFNEFFLKRGMAFLNDFRLPTEAEWEYAARGGLSLSPYPWGGPYIRNNKGCFLGNFKPMRGNYLDDGGLYTVRTTSYWPNDYGLYCMAGNVAEWTGDTYDESAYNFVGDLSPYYNYEAKDNDPVSMKRKVIRGGSWKDIGYYMQTGTRSYEYQDSSKCYIGFRCVISYLGRDKSD